MTAIFKGFKAYRYNSERVEMEKVIAPPYDVINADQQSQLYEQSPYNCIRLILNREESNDTEGNNRYTRARDFFNEWRQESILTQEGNPSIYLYQQTFVDLVTKETKTRTSLLGRLKLEAFEKGVVVPHEKTLSKPKKDRFQLMEATEANLSPIFGLYEDEEHSMQSVHEEVLKGERVFTVSDEEGVKHSLWVVEDDALVCKIQEILAAKKIYIADGHHRYQTALDYSQKKHEEQGIPLDKEMPYDFVLIALVEFNDPGLSLYPTHRMINSFSALPDGFNLQKALEVLEPYFDIEKIEKDTLINRLSQSAEEDIVLGLGQEGQFHFLKLKGWEHAKEKMVQGKPDIWYQLDVNILSHLILAKLWELPEAEWEGTISYTHSENEAFASLEQNKVSAVFFMKAPKVEVLRDMGRVQELMPQKSTYFYPKLASGLVFHHHS